MAGKKKAATGSKSRSRNRVKKYDVLAVALSKLVHCVGEHRRAYRFNFEDDKFTEWCAKMNALEDMYVSLGAKLFIDGDDGESYRDALYAYLHATH